MKQNGLEDQPTIKLFSVTINNNFQKICSAYAYSQLYTQDYTHSQGSSHLYSTFPANWQIYFIYEKNEGNKISRTKLPPEHIFLKSVKATEYCSNKETHTQTQSPPNNPGF